MRCRIGALIYMEIKLGEKLQLLRKNLNYTQKDFAEFLGIPQPSLSAYENDKNSPTTEVLINIATKCNVSIDWLCGLSANTSLNDLSDVAKVLFALLETKEIGIAIKVNDKLPNDMETETDKWYTQLTIFGNDRDFSSNSSVCNIIREINDILEDLESYSISKEDYEIKKAHLFNYYTNSLLTKKIFPELSREERMKKHIEWLNANNTLSEV